MHGSFGPLVFGAAAGLVFAMVIVTEPPSSGYIEEPDPIRLGVYDSRGVAIAWANSEHNNIHNKKAEHRRAKAEGNEARVAELERWGKMQQRRLHFQGFGTYPVDAYLEPVRDKLAVLLRDRDLDAIVWMAHAHGPRVEVVDVTVDLMALLGMDPAAAEEMAREMGKNKPLDFATLFEMDPRD